MSGPTHDPALYRERDLVAIKRALVSVSDKTGLVELATALAAAGVEIVSTGGSAAAIAAAGIRVTQVGDVTGYPESLDGRVRTLHPVIHSGLLADLRLESHERELASQGIAPFELVVSNLYPFVATIAAGITGDAAIEQIDIGGPAMVRASAKNHANVAIVTSPASYPAIVAALAAGGTTLAQRRDLAAEAFAHTAAYDAAVSTWFASNVATASTGSATEGGEASEVADTFTVSASLKNVLRYGENSHQTAALYVSENGTGIAQAEQLHGKEMSYNNFVDADAAVRAAWDFDEPAVAIIKHANPCGIAVARGSGDPIASAHLRAHECDPLSAFGGVIAANRTLTLAAAESIVGIFTEVVVAPDFEPAALELLSTKKNLRLLKLPADFTRPTTEFKQISGGLLVQSVDNYDDFDSSTWTLVAGDEADDATRSDLEFAWRSVRSVKSNAILLADDGASVGVGMGQVNRVDSCELAVSRAGDRAVGSVAASDAFFPFADGLEVLLSAGVRAVVQPGGSIRDEDVIAAAKKAGVTMYFTGERHFFH
ncbi:bifunctional phosphoribosylaminoimidazolecarboxamide formyltransferase/IMP cyclohydrolase [Conyzicola nivalis]|uniref:Bifunctional purine biosynthesis protein PurH n=1 Tax=Conyzicola nivalis TaxID=1477021 RepID=A0A916SQH4_9MICO|nr:bifunctional phosphoribosylaminoimidazolecarboxamide formyltransferase/IMP cyclohydrolase [Conyzicola nivalis]GGB12484.1 bifunctional purine biosynthesis protein PurH [Conyzicola nivalis]